MDIKIFSDLFAIGLHPVPLKWNKDTKQAEIFPDHKTDIRSEDGKPNLTDITRWFNQIHNCNAIALKLYPPFFMLDFDLKNDQRKGIYEDWFNIVVGTNEDVLRKLCIERTRSGGFHVYGKFKGVDNKKMLAVSNDKKEVISVYTGGLLSFCAPTPDYELIHNDFSDIEDLTQDEFDVLCSAAAHFNDYTGPDILSNEKKIVSYPVEYENTALQFDEVCSNDVFEELLNSIGLYEKIEERRGKKKDYVEYLRKGSVAAYSAKVYFYSKKLLIFSGSYVDFPNFHNRINDDDTSWILTPTKIIYYKNGRDWTKTITELKAISKANDFYIVHQKPVTEQPIQNRLVFPYDIFPEKVQQFIFAQTIQHEFLAGAILGAVSASIGNTAVLEAMQGFKLKAVVYIAIVAPPGAAKTPAVKKAFATLEEVDHNSYLGYKDLLEEYERQLAEYEKDKKNRSKPIMPIYVQTLIKDSTIEMVQHILNNNPHGCCVLADELSGFLNRMNRYAAGDDEQKWLSMWSSDPILNQRISTGIKKIEDPFCSVVGGIQPGVLETLSKDARSANGFYHRFLFVYPKLEKKRPWEKVTVPASILSGFRDMFLNIVSFRSGDRTVYELSPDANDLYGKWFNFKNEKYDRSQNDAHKGIIAKYQEYCLRLALLIQVMDDGAYRPGLVTQKNMERAIRLTEYFFGMMLKASRILTPETPDERLQENYKGLWDKLPPSFSTKTFVQLAGDFSIKEGAAKVFLSRQVGKLFQRMEKNVYEKLY